MTPQEIFEYIESLHFDVEMNLASGFNLYRRWLADDENLHALIAQIQQTSTLRQEVFSRLLALLALLPEDFDFNAARYDAALSAYLFALHAVDSELAQQAIERILQTPKLWWVKRLAQHLQAAQTQTP
jgi:hypothetical protein